MIRRDARGRHLIGGMILILGLGVLSAGLTTLVRPTTAADTGAVPAAVSTGSAVPAATSGSPAPTADVGGGARPIPVKALLSAPVGVTIGALQVRAPVDAVGVTRDGRLTVPDDPARLGWWIGSALPGAERGTVLVAGHVDTAAAGRGALFGLEHLAMGQRVDVSTVERTVVYRTVARRIYTKGRLPAELFRADTAPQLALITCGGSFSNGAYDKNVVVYAVPMQ